MMKALKLSGLFLFGFCCELNPSFKCPLRVLCHCLSISSLAYYVPLKILSFAAVQASVHDLFLSFPIKAVFSSSFPPSSQPFSQHSFSPKALIASCSSLKPPWLSCLIKCPSQELCFHLEAIAFSDIYWSIFLLFHSFLLHLKVLLKAKYAFCIFLSRFSSPDALRCFVSYCFCVSLIETVLVLSSHPFVSFPLFLL